MSPPVAGTVEVGADVDHQIGATVQSPVDRELAGGWKVGGVSFGGTGVRPGGEGRNLSLRQGSIVLDPGADLGRGLPGGHDAVLGHGREVVGALSRLLVCVQGERTDLALAVTFLAVLLDDPGDFPTVGGNDLGGLGLRNRAAHGGDMRDLRIMPLEQRGDRVFQVVAGGIGVSHAPGGELIVDPPVVADPAVTVDHERLGRHRRAHLPGERSATVVHHGKLQGEVAA